MRLSVIHGITDNMKARAAAAFPTPFTSPLFTGSLPSRPLIYSPDVYHQKIGNIDLIPPLSLDGQLGKISTLPPNSPSRPRELSMPARSLHEKLQNSPQVGIVHLSLQVDSLGLILSWQNDVFLVAEPGELADKFVQCVKMSLLSQMESPHKKGASFLASMSTVADLVASTRQFQVGCIVHCYVGCQTQVMEDDQEIGAYMFLQAVPATHLTADDNRNRKGIWDDEEAELSQFICELYNRLFREGASVDAALRHALTSHQQLRYSCHLPS